MSHAHKHSPSHRSKSRSRSPVRSVTRNASKHNETQFKVDDEDPIRPTPEEEDWIVVVKKSRKQRGVEHEPLPHAPATLDISNPDQLRQAQDALLQKSKTDIRRERRRTKAEHLREAMLTNMKRWKKSTTLEQN